MSDEYVHSSGNSQVEALVQDFRELPAEDRDLAIALVTRLRASGQQTQEFPPDVTFMDFDI